MVRPELLDQELFEFISKPLAVHCLTLVKPSIQKQPVCVRVLSVALQCGRFRYVPVEFIALITILDGSAHVHLLHTWSLGCYETEPTL
jgi:hypothetical protein